MVCLISGDIKLSLKVMYHNHLDYQVDKRIINIEVRNKTIDITESRSNILVHSENVNSIVKGTILTLSIVWFNIKPIKICKIKVAYNYWRKWKITICGNSLYISLWVSGLQFGRLWIQVIKNGVDMFIFNEIYSKC